MVRGLALALLLIEGVAWAEDPLARARAAVAESDYLAARPALAAALDAGGRSPDELAEIYRLSGIVAAALGDARAATEAFTHQLALSPTAMLPAGTSPKIRRPFDAAGRYVKTHAPLELKVETRSSPPTVTLVVVNDPLHMVATAHVVFAVDGGVERTRDVVASQRTDVTLPAGRRIDARMSALDAHGNHLVEIGSKDVPIVIVGEAPPAPLVASAQAAAPAPVTVHAASRPVQPWRRWWPYAAVAVAAGGVAGYFAWSARADVDELDRLSADTVPHRRAELDTVEDRGRRHLLYMNLGFGAAGAFAIAAGVIYLTTPRSAESRVAATPVPGGGMIVYGGNF